MNQLELDAPERLGYYAPPGALWHHKGLPRRGGQRRHLVDGDDKFLGGLKTYVKGVEGKVTGN